MRRTLRDYPEVSLALEELGGRIQFAEIFGRACPVHVELGTGKGTFLVNEAKAQPEVGFLGVEWARKYYRYAVDRIGRHGLRNVRIIRADAASFIADFLADESVECFHIYFPDPWPKKRHHKRRLINAANLQQLLRCLKRGGLIRIATDHAGYFEAIEEVVGAAGAGLERVGFAPTAGAGPGEVTGTNYERKYIKDERDIYTVAVRKK